MAMTTLRNGGAAQPKSGPEGFQQQISKTSSGSEAMAALTRLAASAGGGWPHRGSGRLGAHRGRAAAAPKYAKKTTGKKITAGAKRGESCAWPAYARSVAKAEAEALAAVSSLYEDELKPFGRILRKRIAERILEDQGIVADITNLDALPEVDGRQVRSVCDFCELLRVDEEEGGDWSAVFVDRAPTFVDVYSPLDCYEAQFWSGFRTYCEGPAGQGLSLPGGRYACAQALKALQLPFLAAFSLGRLCHVVQLAISQKKVLGYVNGAVVPYARSQSMMKDRCALYGQPSTGKNYGQSNSSKLPIASLEVARKHLLEILNTAKGEMPLSNVKRLFRSRYHVELSETSFGFSKVSELLQDSKFSDICRVELRGHGYTVVQTERKGACLEDGLRRAPVIANKSLSLDGKDALVEGSPMILVPTPTPTISTPEVGDAFISCYVQHTFLQYKVPRTPLPGSKRRSYSLPKDMGCSEWSLRSETSLADNTARSLPNPSNQHTSDDSGSEVFCVSPKRASSASSTGLSSDEASFGCISQLPSDMALHDNCFLSVNHTDNATSLVAPTHSESAGYHVNFCPAQPFGPEESGGFWGRMQDDMPLLISEMQAPASDWIQPAEAFQLTPVMRMMNADGEVGMVTPIGNESARPRVVFCPDEPLDLEEAGIIAASPKLLTKATGLPSPAPTPSPLYNYSNPVHWCPHRLCPPAMQELPAMGLAMAPSSSELGYVGNLPTSHSIEFGHAQAFTALDSSELGYAGISAAPSMHALPCPGGFAAPSLAQAEDFCSTASNDEKQRLHPGRVIRLREYI